MSLFLILLLLPFSIARADMDCNDLLSSDGLSREVSTATDHLAELRIDLDLQLSRGQSNMLARLLESDYQKKKREILEHLKKSNVDEVAFDSVLKKKIRDRQNALKEVNVGEVATREAQTDAVDSARILPVSLKYHSQTMTADGESIVAGGVMNGSRPNRSVFVLNPSKNSIREFENVLRDEVRYRPAQYLSDENTLVIVGGNGPFTIDVLDLKTMKLVQTIQSRHRFYGTSGDIRLRPISGGFLSILQQDAVEVLDLKTGKSLSYTPHKVRLDGRMSFLQDGRVVSVDQQGVFVTEARKPRRELSKQISTFAKESHSQIVLENHLLLTVGGRLQAGSTDHRGQNGLVHLIDLNTGEIVWSELLNEVRYTPRLDLMSDGRVVVSGGWGGTANATTVEVIDVVQRTIKVAGTLDVVTESQTSGVTPDGLWVGVGGALPEAEGASVQTLRVGL